jgi:hypothetical protein
MRGAKTTYFWAKGKSELHIREVKTIHSPVENFAPWSQNYMLILEKTLFVKPEL